jgi:phosphodiesterase/alkaline phosphatase D-like protein
MQRTTKRFGLVVFLVMAVLGVGLAPAPAVAATSSMLTRYPYLTDSIQSSITVNWATDRTGASTGSLTWGLAGNCDANTTTATRTSITVISKPEYQWKATIPVTPDTQYCYRVKLGTVDLLGTDSSPSFTSQVAAGSNEPFSFAVFGDWGQAYAGGVNTHQTNRLSEMAYSGARFAVLTGDTAYPGGGQTEYRSTLTRAASLPILTSREASGRCRVCWTPTTSPSLLTGTHTITSAMHLTLRAW